MEDKNKSLLIQVAEFKESAQNEAKKIAKQQTVTMSTPRMNSFGAGESEGPWVL